MPVSAVARRSEANVFPQTFQLLSPNSGTTWVRVKTAAADLFETFTVKKKDPDKNLTRS